MLLRSSNKMGCRGGGEGDGNASKAVDSPSNKRKRSSSSFANLSDDIIESIFTYLPINLVADIGAWSTRFQRSWKLSRNLDFGKEFMRLRSPDHYVEIVEQVLKVYASKKVHRLRLYIPFRFNDFNTSSMVSRWIKFAIERGVEELDLDFSVTDEYFFPTKLLDGASPSVLKLCHCRFLAPEILEQFHCLKSLSLCRVELSGSLVHIVLANCLLLESLELKRCSRYYKIRISEPRPRLKRMCVVNCISVHIIELNAPNLHQLQFHGYYSRFSLDLDSFSVPKLGDASICFTNEIPWPCTRPMKLVSRLANVSKLTFNSRLFERIAPSLVHDKLELMQVSFNNLEEFNLSLEEKTFVNALDIAFFLAHCPSLLRFSLDLSDFAFDCGIYWEFHGAQKLEEFTHWFHTLKVIQVKGFKFHEHELLLVKLLLGRADILETMNLITPKGYYTKIRVQELQADQRLSCLHRASPNAKLVVGKHSRRAVNFGSSG